MVLDSKTAVAGMLGGLELCYRTVVPAMFPFLFLSSLLLSELSGKQNRMLQSLAKRLGIPPGGEGILVVGLLGGYPTGAASVADFYKHNKLQRHHAERLLGFCNNAGPAFIFGMAGNLFPLKAAWVLWGIHILSAIITATILPQTTVTAIKKATQNHISAGRRSRVRFYRKTERTRCISVQICRVFRKSPQIKRLRTFFESYDSG